MNPEQTLAIGLYGFVAVFACIFLYRRWRWRRRRRKGKTAGFYPQGAALGNALHQLQSIAQPQTRYVIEEKLKEEIDEDGEGGPDDPTRHLHCQARKIRRGDKLERLATFLPRQK
ncbi:hypothetical protein [Edaphobacter sp. 12200R-103]|jgi:hypothetical protein|uniref:hypothetical protein n=1 Tax=Edaphobacter sp. 12200R-103 TaxID=2703788 RepID=UPI00138D16D6|nr:hypothetical protein [Edaphobacter sp. 12200R-103]QHS52488.1 hypothetical protein GWR55_12675 [Edaphobacter sp. 12200R-103]